MNLIKSKKTKKNVQSRIQLEKPEKGKIKQA